ncbi:6433_t:CDS:2 [Gigaspora rosea]|nr:6433_t:CDS:2 [Gigaspora rosea]
MMNSLLIAGLLKTLSKDLCHLLDEAIEYNVLITTGAGDNTKTFKAHTVILRSRSTYFHNALSDTWAKKESDNIVFTKPNISPEAFEVILNHQQWMRENFVLIYQTAFLKGSFKNLQSFCLEIIEKTPDIIFKAKDFTDIDPKLLATLLGQSNLLTPEIEVWDSIIKWGIFNTSPPLGLDYKTWSNDSFEKLKETLQQFIPLINFTVISSSDFYQKIIPFQHILPNDLYDDLLKFHLAPQINPSHPFLRSPKRNQQFQSIFINNVHAAWIMSQVDYDKSPTLHNGNNPKLFPYNLKLLIRGSNGVRKVVIIGGTGFIGKYVAKAFVQDTNTSILMGARHSKTDDLKLWEGNQILPPMKCDITSQDEVLETCEGANIIVNLVGIMHENPPIYTFENVQHLGARNVAMAAKQNDAQLIHLSAIGADPKSEIPYARTKGLGEIAIREIYPTATIIRPSIVFGPEDDFFNRFSKLARFLPFMPVFGGGFTKFQPVYVWDLAMAVVKTSNQSLKFQEFQGKVFEIGGPKGKWKIL